MENTKKNITLLKHIIESMNEMVCVVDDKSNVVFSNSKMERVIGTKKDRKCPGMMGKNDCDICYAKNSFEQGRPQNMIYELNGRVYNVALSPIREDNNSIEHVLEVWTDVTGESRLKERLTAQNRLLRNDLELASTLQKSMLPYDIKARNGIRFDMMYLPCEDVGGDFYDIFFTNENEVVFYIADVSGHGVSAAMLTVFFSQTVRSVMESQLDEINPAEVLTEVWQRFMKMDIQEHLYITAWMAVLNLDTGELKYSNAGHIIAPLLYGGDKIQMLESSGFPVCRWIPNSNYVQKKTTIPKGGRILLYTDGLSDAWRTLEASRISQEYETPDALARGCLKIDAFEDILNVIWKSVSSDENMSRLSDDVAMLLIERTQ
ncbi:MAG: SpoIIE family protein phosphatase [Clostridiales bacterium]|nr:SpoIIE family protein phosphatase [Clostridiales bacterium]